MLKKSIIKKNLSLSLLFGLFMGIAFPIFANVFVTFNSEKSKIIFIVLCIVAGIVVGVSAFLITRFTIIKIVMEIDEQMLALVSGGHENLEHIELDSHDVIGSLVKNFNSFITSLELMSTSLKNIIKRDGEISGQLVSNREETLKSEKRVINSVEGINSVLKLNRDDLCETVEFTSNIKNLSEDLYSAIKNQKAEVDDSSGSVINILDLIKKADEVTQSQVQKSSEMLGTIKSALDKTGDTNSSINSISKNADQITNEINHINEIADRTSILAINASIEAARAGEVGKGFKIIASEVRELAENSKKYAGEISQDIIKMVESIKVTTELSSDNLRSLTTLNGFMSDFNSGQSVIMTNIDHIKVEGDVIYKGMESLKADEENILKLTDDINKVSTDVDSRMVKTYESTKETSSTILSISEDLKVINRGSEDVYALLQKNEEELKLSEDELKIFIQ